MTRLITRSMSGILEHLELERPALVTIDQLHQLAAKDGLRTPAKVIAARMREQGWLLPTGRRGVWEFAPAALAGPYSSHDPLTPLRAFLSARPDAKCALTFQAAAWAHGLANRVPKRPEVAAATSELSMQLPSQLAGTVFAPKLRFVYLRRVPVLAVESILVHMVSRPSAVRSWSSAVEWLPELAETLDLHDLNRELDNRPSTVLVRAGYVLQGLRPDLSAALLKRVRTGNKTWFGPRRPIRRHDAKWEIADTLLPFDPRELQPVT